MNETDERIKCTRCSVSLPMDNFRRKRCGNLLKTCNLCRTSNRLWIAKKKDHALASLSDTPSSATSSPIPSPRSSQIPQLSVVTRDGRYVYHGSCDGRPTVWITKSPWDDCRTISVRFIDGCFKYSDLNGDDIEVLESDDAGWSEYVTAK